MTATEHGGATGPGPTPLAGHPHTAEAAQEQEQEQAQDGGHGGRALRQLALANYLLSSFLDREHMGVFHGLQCHLAKTMTNHAQGLLHAVTHCDAPAKRQFMQLFQLLCEGHFLPGQEAFRESGLLLAVAEYLSGMPQCELSEGEPAEEPFVGVSESYIQACLTLSEAQQGPNLANQMCLFDDRLALQDTILMRMGHQASERLAAMKAHDGQDVRSSKGCCLSVHGLLCKGRRAEEHTAVVVKRISHAGMVLCLEHAALNLLSAMLEGSTNKPHGVTGALSKSVSFDTLVTNCRFYNLMDKRGDQKFEVEDPVRLVARDPQEMQRQYWSVADTILSFMPKDDRLELEPKKWDNQGINNRDLNFRRVEIDRLYQGIKGIHGIDNFDDITRLEPYYFQASDWTNKVSDEFKDDILTSNWNFDDTSVAARQENLNKVCSLWLVHGFLFAKVGDFYDRFPWFCYLIDIVVRSNQVRPLLTMAINIVMMSSINHRSQINDDMSNAFCKPIDIANVTMIAGMANNHTYTGIPDSCDTQLPERIIRFLGTITITMNFVQLYKFIEVNGMATVMTARVSDRHNWRSIRQNPWMFTKANRRTGERVPNPWGIIAILNKTKFTGYKVYWEAFKTVKKQPYMLYLCFLFVTNWVALAAPDGSQLWLYSLHMIEIAVASKSVKNVVFPALTYLWNVIMLVISAFCMMFIFATIMWQFAPVVLQRVSISKNSLQFDSLPEAIMYVINYGFRMGGGIGDVQRPYFMHANDDATKIGLPTFLFGSHTMIPYRWFQWGLEMVFMLVIVVFFMNIILVVMVDGVAEYKEKIAVKDQKQSSNCTVCGLDRDTLDGEGNGFVTHMKREHELWCYLDLVETLVGREFTDFNGTETAVGQCLLDGVWTFVPFMDTLEIQKNAPLVSVEKEADNDREELKVMVGALLGVVGEQSKALASMQTQLDLLTHAGQGGGGAPQDTTHARGRP